MSLIVSEPASPRCSSAVGGSLLVALLLLPGCGNQDPGASDMVTAPAGGVGPVKRVGTPTGPTVLEFASDSNQDFPRATMPHKDLNAIALLNRPAPEILVESWLTEQPDLAGKLVLIDFWATWCNPCKKAIPELNELHRKFGDRLVVIGLSSDSVEAVRYMLSPPMNYYVGVDPSGITMREFGIQSIPSVCIIDPRGIVRWQGAPMDPRDRLTEAKVAALIETYTKAEVSGAAESGAQASSPTQEISPATDESK